MKQNTLAVFLLGAIAGAFAISAVPAARAVAAPFNAATTKRADAGVVTSFCIYRGETGVPYFTGVMDIPEVRTLADGGTRTVVLSLVSDRCPINDAPTLTAANNFATTSVAPCVRASNDLEQ